MAHHNRDPSLGSDTDDQETPSSEPSRETDTLDRTWPTRVHDSEVPYVGDSLVRTTAQANDLSTLERAQLEEGDTEDTEPGLLERGNTIVQSEETEIGESGTFESSECELAPVNQPVR